MGGSGDAGAASGVSADQERYNKWKQLTPYLYDWLTNHNLTWPSLSCRWGPVINDAKPNKWKTQQLLYLSEQTSGDEPNKLTILSADIVKPRTAAAEVIRQFDETKHSVHIRPYQTIFHPGEVNKIREVPGHESILVTHTDSPEVLVWSLDRQPNRAGDKGAARQQMSVPDLVLDGHTDIAEFALGISSKEPLVASGGRDTNVLIWSIADHVASLAAAGPKDNATKGEKLAHRIKLEGHTATIEDVVWKPDSTVELGSVGDDRALLLWDTRAGTGPAQRRADAHGTHDLHTVDWSGLRDDLLATGAADGTLKIWDRRKLGPKDTALFTFDLHTEALMHVEWCPHRPGVLASCGEDQVVYVWDLDQQRRPAGEPEAKRAKGAYPPQLLLTHAGHRASVVDFHWNPAEPFTLMSVADESSLEKGGGTLQLWRISDLITRTEEEVLAELEPHRDFIITGSKSAVVAVHTKGKAPPAEVKPEADALIVEDSAAAAAEEGSDAAMTALEEGEEDADAAGKREHEAKEEPVSAKSEGGMASADEKGDAVETSEGGAAVDVGIAAPEAAAHMETD